jgi:hypothetical protein
VLHDAYFLIEQTKPPRRIVTGLWALCVLLDAGKDQDPGSFKRSVTGCIDPHRGAERHSATEIGSDGLADLRVGPTTTSSVAELR